MYKKLSTGEKIWIILSSGILIFIGIIMVYLGWLTWDNKTIPELSYFFFSLSFIMFLVSAAKAISIYEESGGKKDE